MQTQPDASGGLGSFPSQLLATLTGGLKLVAQGELSKRYGYSFGADDTIAVNADGQVRPSAAPASPLSAGAQLAHVFGNPLVLTGVIAIGIALVLVLVRR